MDGGTLTGPGRGRGNATNVPERLLIEQVKLRPVLYDKKEKDYRKVSGNIYKPLRFAIRIQFPAGGV